MWVVDPVLVNVKRPLWGFAAVTLLCAVLMMSGVESGGPLRGLFHAAKPIAATTTPEAVSDDAPVVVEKPRFITLPAELIVQPVGTSRATLVEVAERRASKVAGQRVTPRWERARR